MVLPDYRSPNVPRPPRHRSLPRNDTGQTSHPEDEWEDVKVHRSSSPASSAARRRGRRSETAFVASQPRKPRRQPAQPVKTRRKYYTEYPQSGSDVDETPPSPPPGPQQQFLLLPPPPRVETAEQRPLAEVAKEYATPIFSYVVKVVADAFHFNRRIFSVALGITIVWLLSTMMTSQLVYFARPMCSLPIISPMIPFCRWEVFTGPPAHSSAGRPVHWADYPKLIDLQTRTFDQLLDESIGSKGLAVEVKKAEMANNDLITLVRVSDLKSKDQIAERLNRFSDDARGTGRSLHSLGAKIQGAVDSITSLNDHALRTIEASKTPPSLVARIVPFAVSSRNPTKEAVIETFLMSMDNIGTHMARLREEADISMGHLMRLEEHLSVLHEITHRDDKQLTMAQDEVLAELWSSLGGNRRKLKKMTINLNLLKNVDKYRRKALTHIVVTLETIQALDADMEELRTRVEAPDIVGDKIPIEVHINSIKAGLDRLKEGQMKASLRQGESLNKILEINA